ncbi:MAG: TIGR02281 family clan AA aspartic protease [Porticoccaceae bacterium]|nr:TIGR02281 family clan AA aspartic protease [Porticoccaceae bacterium]
MINVFARQFRLLKPLVIALLSLAMIPAEAAPEVKVQGLFANRAVLLIDGEIRLLKAGERSPEGVLLVSSTSREAVVEIGGVRKTLGLSQQIAGSFTEAESNEVRVPRDSDSHYRVGGAINGKPVTMMIDTGATAVVLNLNDARRLGIDYRKGTKSFSSTAGGIVNTYSVVLDRVSVGNILLYNVQAAVVVGDFPQQILLGNTFLSRVSMVEEGGVLVIRNKF